MVILPIWCLNLGGLSNPCLNCIIYYRVNDYYIKETQYL